MVQLLLEDEPMSLSPDKMNPLKHQKPTIDITTHPHIYKQEIPASPLLESINKVDLHRSKIHENINEKADGSIRHTAVRWPSFWRGISHMFDALRSFVSDILTILNIKYSSTQLTYSPSSPRGETADIEEAVLNPDSEENILPPEVLAAAESKRAALVAETAANAAENAPDYATALAKAMEAANAADAALNAAENARTDPSEYSAALIHAANAAVFASGAAQSAATQARSAADTNAEISTPTTTLSEQEQALLSLLSLPLPEEKPETAAMEKPNNSILGRIKVAVSPKENRERKELERGLQSWVEKAENEYDREVYIRATKRIMEAYDTNATMLNVAYFKLPHLPEVIFSNKRFQENLVNLDVSGNQLTRFPIGILALKNLKVLSMTFNQIPEIPTQIELLKELKKFDASDNQLTALPTQICRLKNLQDLMVARNEITRLPVQLAHLKNLVKLDLTYNRLTELSPKIFTLPNIRWVSTSLNMIQDIPKNIPGNCTFCNDQRARAQQQSAWSTNRGSVNTQSSSRSSVQNTSKSTHAKAYLELPNDTIIEAIAKAAAAAAQAESIKTTEESLSDYSSLLVEAAATAEIAAAIAQRNARALVESAEKARAIATPTTPPTLITERPKSASKRIRTPGKSQHITSPIIDQIKGIIGMERDWERFQMEAILNQWINELGTDTTMDRDETEIRVNTAKKIMEAYDSDTTKLNLIGLNFTYIPTGILNNSKFRKNITEVNMGANRIDEFPRDLLDLKNLEALILNGNAIPILPTQIEKLTHLNKLDISSNIISTLPTQIGKLKELTELTFASNNISMLPTQIAHLENLQSLDIACNEIEKVPETILKMPQLKILSLSRNRIKDIPQSKLPLRIYDFGQREEPGSKTQVWKKRSSDKERDELVKLYNRNRRMGW